MLTALGHRIIVLPSYTQAVLASIQDIENKAAADYTTISKVTNAKMFVLYPNKSYVYHILSVLKYCTIQYMLPHFTYIYS